MPVWANMSQLMASRANTATDRSTFCQYAPNTRGSTRQATTGSTRGAARYSISRQDISAKMSDERTFIPRSIRSFLFFNCGYILSSSSFCLPNSPEGLTVSTSRMATRLTIIVQWEPT